MSPCTNMRRRMVDYGKLKRLSTRKSKAAEPVQTSNSYIHWKLLVGWIIVILLDSLANFRFEYLYPLIMFFRSIYDSYKYQGLIFCILFVCLVAYLDLLCWSVLSGPWLFLGASSCVWLEIMRSIGLDQAFSYSALSLWMLFLYVEVSHRLHSIPQHLFNISRPFAAHCIGYPVVTMSFLIKHHITHIIRQRQQKKVAEENSLYFGILQKALPPPPPDETKATDDPQQPGSVDELSNNVGNHVPTTAGSVGIASGTTSSSTDRHHHGRSGHKISPKSSSSSGSSSGSGGGGASGSGSSGGGSSSGKGSQKAQSSSGSRHRPSSGLKLHEGAGNRERSSSVSRQNQQQSSLATPTSPVAAEQSTTPTSPVSPTSTAPSSAVVAINMITSSIPPTTATVAVVNGDVPLVDGAVSCAGQTLTAGGSGAAAAKIGGVVSSSGKKQATVRAVPRVDQPVTTAQEKSKQLLESIQLELKQEKQAKLEAEATVGQLELELKKLKADLHASNLQEEETSSRVEHLISLEKYHKQELQRLRTENESLQQKLSKLKSGKEHDQAAITELEKKLSHEADARTRVEAKLRDHQHAARNSWSGEEVKELKDKLTASGKELEKVKNELAKCEKVREELREKMDGKVALIAALENEKQQLKMALADETRVKIEMFTALSDAGKKHREEINRKNFEIQRLQRNLAEILAILPAMGLPPPIPPTTVAAQQAQAAASGGQRISPTSPTGVSAPSNGGGSGGSGFPQPGGSRPPPSSTP